MTVGTFLAVHSYPVTGSELNGGRGLYHTVVKSLTCSGVVTVGGVGEGRVGGTVLTGLCFEGAVLLAKAGSKFGRWKIVV